MSILSYATRDILKATLKEAKRGVEYLHAQYETDNGAALLAKISAFLAVRSEVADLLKLKGRPCFYKPSLPFQIFYFTSSIWIGDEHKLSMCFARGIPLPEVIEQWCGK